MGRPGGEGVAGRSEHVEPDHHHGGRGHLPNTILGLDAIAVLLADFFSPSAPFLFATGLGDRTSAENTSAGSPNLSYAGSGKGLNVRGCAGGPGSDFVAVNRAFCGSSTWTADAARHAEAFAGASGGSVFFPAGSDLDIPGGTLPGEWGREGAAVPLPATAWLFGAAPLALGAALTGESGVRRGDVIVS